MSMVNEKRVDEALEDLHDGQPDVDAVLPGLNSFEIWRMVERLEQARSALQQNNEKMRKRIAECYMPPDEYQRLLALGANYEATVEQCKYLQAENDKLHAKALADRVALERTLDQLHAVDVVGVALRKQLADAMADRGILQNDLNAALEFCVCPAAHGRKDPGSCGDRLSSEQRAALTAEVEKANGL